MSEAYRCDRCRQIIEDGVFTLDEYAPGDGNAWSVRVYINRIDTKGPLGAHLHRRCWLELVTAAIGELDA